jgi:exopolysaccharide biosynthesis polyprenyl glycosylphosphotransferase
LLPSLRQPKNSEREWPISEGATQTAVLRRDARYRRGLAAADVISAGSAVALGVAVLGNDKLTLSVLAALPLVVVVSKMIGLYDRDEDLLRKTTLDELPAILHVATLYALLIWLSEGLFVQGSLGQRQLLILWLLLFVLMALGRSASRRMVQTFTPAERCLLIGDAAAAKAIEKKFKQSSSVKATLVGRVPLKEHEVNGAAPPILGDLNSLGPLLAEHRIHRVVVAPDLSDSEKILDTVRQVKLLGVRVSVLPRLFEVVGSSVAFDDIDGLTLLGLHRYGLTKSSEILKRVMDLAGAALGLMVLLPALVAIAVAVKCASPGPVLFRQRRIGRDGVEFELIKFRTMVDGADSLKAGLLELNEGADGFFKIADDPRVTRVGRFLRRTYFDELPQLINVLRGEMSLVGPRPLVPDEDRCVEGWQRDRLMLKPGMTGHWQIFGSSRIPLREMVKIDYLYGANWSLWSDTKILLRTVPYVVRRAGL